MKPFESYQHLDGFPYTNRDTKQVGSKFWNEGKWTNFVLPHLPKDPSGQTFIDMGCNAGLFLRMAKDLGFSKVIGVDSSEQAVRNGLEWRDSRGYDYDLRLGTMEKALEDLPIADYTVLANAHYYFTINDFLDYIDKLQFKTRYLIIVTAEKHHGNRCWASAHVPDIRGYFKHWEEVGFIDELPTEGDPDPRRLWSLCFKSPFVDKLSVDKIDSGNHVQDEFYAEIDAGKQYFETRYYRILKKYRKNWGEDRLNNWFLDRLCVYESVKRCGQTKPILIDADNLIVDGNHRFGMLRHLGNKEVFVRNVWSHRQQ